MEGLVRDYASIMYKDGVTRRMLERYGDMEINALNAAQLIEISTYVTIPICRNPFAVALCKRAQGKNFTGNVTYKLYQGVCKGYGYEVH